jgi:hypothetical protein
MKGVVGIQFFFKSHSVRLEQCCYLTYFSTFSLVVPSPTYSRGEAGHTEIMIQLQMFFFNDYEEF